jgi:hypothetical protein
LWGILEPCSSQKAEPGCCQDSRSCDWMKPNCMFTSERTWNNCTQYPKKHLLCVIKE